MGPSRLTTTARSPVVAAQVSPTASIWKSSGATLNAGGLTCPRWEYVRHPGESNHQSTTASVIDLVTLSNGAYFDVNFFDAQDWNITPGVSFTNIDPSPTPLPATLPLFTAGLSVMGLLGWRRKQKKQQAGITGKINSDKAPAETPWLFCASAAC